MFEDIEKLKDFLRFSKDELKVQEIKVGEVHVVFSGLSYVGKDEEGYLSYEDKLEGETEDEMEADLRKKNQDKRDLEDDLAFSAD